VERHFLLTDEPPAGTFQRLWDGLRNFNQQAVGEAQSRLLTVLLQDAADVTIGGLWGRTLWGQLYIDILFVPEELRRNGMGRELVLQAEEEAVRRGCHCSWLDTYEFQAKPFYERLGYEVFGTLEGPAPVYPRYFLRKRLNASFLPGTR